jgi:hypothetical protein
MHPPHPPRSRPTSSSASNVPARSPPAFDLQSGEPARTCSLLALGLPSTRVRVQIGVCQAWSAKVFEAHKCPSRFLLETSLCLTGSSPNCPSHQLPLLRIIFLPCPSLSGPPSRRACSATLVRPGPLASSLCLTDTDATSPHPSAGFYIVGIMYASSPHASLTS